MCVISDCLLGFSRHLCVHNTAEFSSSSVQATKTKYKPAGDNSSVLRLWTGDRRTCSGRLFHRVYYDTLKWKHKWNHGRSQRGPRGPMTPNLKFRDVSKKHETGQWESTRIETIYEEYVPVPPTLRNHLFYFCTCKVLSIGVQGAKRSCPVLYTSQTCYNMSRLSTSNSKSPCARLTIMTCTFPV